jgi:hypothetical protein
MLNNDENIIFEYELTGKATFIAIILDNGDGGDSYHVEDGGSCTCHKYVDDDDGYYERGDDDNDSDNDDD